MPVAASGGIPRLSTVTSSHFSPALSGHPPIDLPTAEPGARTAAATTAAHVGPPSSRASGLPRLCSLGQAICFAHAPRAGASSLRGPADDGLTLERCLRVLVEDVDQRADLELSEDGVP